MTEVDQFLGAIQSTGLTPPADIIPDGKIHRFASNGRRGDDAGWYAYHCDAIPAGIFGDWRTNIKQSWRPDVGRSLTPAEQAAHNAKVEAMKRERDADDARRRAEAARKAAAIWKGGHPALADHSYLQRKHVFPVVTLREIHADQAAKILGYRPQAKGEELAGRLLVVPIKIGAKISTAELIDETGRKSAIAGGAKSSGYWAAQPLPEGNGNGLTLLVGEGVATVLSAKEATGHLGIAALSCGNVAPVALAMRERYPKARLVILADLGNGQTSAEEAARAVGGSLAIPDFGTNRPDGVSDFNDLVVLSGAEAVARAILNASEPLSEASKSDRADWPDPLPLVTKIEPEPYPLDAMPDTIRAAVVEVQQFTKAPTALVASSALGALSLAVQALTDVKRAEKLTGPVGLFLLTIADSGERKSTCDEFFTAASREYQGQRAEAAKPDLAAYRANLAAWEAKHGGIKDKIRQLAKSNKPSADLEATLRDLEKEKPQAPRVPRLLRGDDTPENLAWALMHEWPAAGVISSEAALILGAHGMGKDSIMRNLGLLNVLWDGGSLPIGRRHSESFTVKGARLTVALQVQEATLRNFFERSDGLARGTGLMARFLIAWPESTQGSRPFTEAPPNWPALAAFNRKIARVLEQPVPIDDDGFLSPPVMSLAPEAKTAWVAFHDAIEGELVTGGELFDVRDVASKSADNAARLAALFQIFEHGMCGAVGLDAFEGASRIVAWHLNESRRFFGELALPAELANAARLDNWLREYCRRGRTHFVPTKKVQQFGPGGLREKGEIDTAMRELEDLSRARLAQDGRRRIIMVNPALLVDGGMP